MGRYTPKMSLLASAGGTLAEACSIGAGLALSMDTRVGMSAENAEVRP